MAVGSAFAQPLPDTEKGNVILRAFDQYNFGPLFPTYIGHVGIMGEWQGPDPNNGADFDIYDMQQTSITVRSTWTLTFYNTMVQRRNFWAFTSVNALLDQDHLSYDGGYVRRVSGGIAPSGPPMDPDSRDAVVDEAISWGGVYLTTKFMPFAKWPSTQTFRCDGIVEYMLERAGVGSGKGFWHLYLEGLIVTPSLYPLWMVAEREYGERPTLTMGVTGGSSFGDGAAISSTSITVTATEESTGSGLKKVVLAGPTSSTRTLNGELTATESFSGLANGAYQVSAFDLAGNVSSAQFRVDTSSPSTPTARNAFGGLQGAVVTSTNNVGIEAEQSASGICEITLTGPGGFSASAEFDAASGIRWGAFELVTQGTYTATATGCNTLFSSKDFFYSTSSVASLSICATHPIEGTKCANAGVNPPGDTILNGIAEIVGFSGHTPLELGSFYRLNVEGEAITSLGGPNGYTSTFSGTPPRSRYFSVTNTTTTTQDAGISITAHVKESGGPNDYTATVSFSSGIAGGGVVVGTVSIAELGQSYAAAATSATFSSRINHLLVTQISAAVEMLSQAYRQGLYLLGLPHAVAGSEFVLVQPGTMTFVAADPGSQPAVSTDTLKLYSWTGSSWTLAGIGQVSVSKSTTTGVVTAIATTSRSGTYAMLFSVSDASAPVTTWSIDGSSGGFQGVTLVSTYSYLVLSSTDPLVNGFASGLATTYYRIDGLPGDPFSAYTSSLSFIPGTHWVDHYAVDWAGNIEPIKRATITVTAGSFTRLSGDLQVDGNLLVGFLGSGARAEVVARAEYDYALKVSSVDGRAMLAVDNANFVSIGTAPASGRLTLQGVPQDAALSLRSGNSTASFSGAQLAFGYDGQGLLRHAVHTQHGSAAYNNRMEFALWSPSAASSSALAGTPVLSLQGSTITAAQALVEIRPANVAGDPANAELEVSNGVTTGGGYVLRAEAWAPSSLAYKTNVRRLGREDEERAYADVAALKPAVFRRKRRDGQGRPVEDPGAPLERGLVFEQSPASIRGQPGEIILDERLVNAELALKAAMRRVAELEARLKKLKEEGR